MRSSINLITMKHRISNMDKEHSEIYQGNSNAYELHAEWGIRYKEYDDPALKPNQDIGQRGKDREGRKEYESLSF